MTAGFTGPLFIIGMPRSGTKLLRDVLNNHSRIAIPPVESNVLPYYYHNAYKFDYYSDPMNFDRFFKEFKDSRFHSLMAKAKIDVPHDAWLKGIREWSCSGIFEAYFVAYAKRQDKSIWGDKSPGYQSHTRLLKSMFPAARFVHIVRDVRDAALSSNAVWGKNIYRYAQRWSDALEEYHTQVSPLNAGDFVEVRYEDLLVDPEGILRRICSFLGIPFEEGMTRLSVPTERYGRARNREQIVSGNRGQWKQRLTSRQVERIESVAADGLARYGYSVSYPGRPKRLGPLRMRYYQLIDGVNLYRFHLRDEEMSPLGVLRIMTSSYRRSSDRDY